MRQLILDIGLEPEPSFASFVVGHNAPAMQHLQRWATETAQQQMPLYLWGPHGAGKTHLLRAARQALSERGASVGWLDAGASPQAPFDEGWDAVILDDVQAYDASLQHAAFRWFVQAMAPADGTPCAVLAAGQLPPADLPLREDLRTRLAWGHVFELQPLSEAHGRAALRQAAEARGLLLSDEVMDYIWTRFSRNLGDLMPWLERLDRYSLQMRRAITIPLIRAMLEAESDSVEAVF